MLAATADLLSCQKAEAQSLSKRERGTLSKRERGRNRFERGELNMRLKNYAMEEESYTHTH
jgi:hypothetical protein